MGDGGDDHLRAERERHGTSAMAARLDQHDLHGKVNYYAPVLTALSLAAPLYRGDLWRIRGRIGKSVRTHHRSTIAPAISIHPKKSLRLEFKPFCYFLLWLALIVDEKLEGRAPSRRASTTWGRSRRAAGGRNRARACARGSDPSARGAGAVGLRSRAPARFGRTPGDGVPSGRRDHRAVRAGKSIPAVLRSRVGLVP